MEKQLVSAGQKPVFSVIIPAHNEEDFLPLCLQSVFKQRFNLPYEIVVVDNASTDKTPLIAKQFKTRLFKEHKKLITLRLVKELKKGLITARTAGLKAAMGDYIINLDADCTVPPDWLRKIYAHVKANRKTVLVTGPYICLEPGQKQDLLNLGFTFFLHSWQKLFHQAFVYYGGNVAIKRSALLKIGGYDLRFPSDQLSLLTRLRKNNGQTVFDKTLKVTSSPRRTAGRFWKWIFKEVIFLYFFNNLYIKITGKSFGYWEDIR